MRKKTYKKLLFTQVNMYTFYILNYTYLNVISNKTTMYVVLLYSDEDLNYDT
jgi:hypothetical protein